MADAKALTDIATSYTTLAGGDLFGVERSGTVGKFTWNSFQAQDMTLSGDITFTGTTAFAALSASGVLSVASDIQHIGDTDNKIAFGTDTQSFETGGTSRLDLSDSGVRLGATGARVTDIETTITDSDTKLPTSGAVVDYVAANGARKAVLAAEYVSGTTPPSFSSGSWAALELNTERHDDIGVSISSNQIVFANAGTYRIFAHIVSQNNSGGGRVSQIRTYNATQTSVGDYGGAVSSQTAAASFNTVDSVMTVSASDAVEIQGRANGSGLSTFQAADFGSETGLQVTIERIA